MLGTPALKTGVKNLLNELYANAGGLTPAQSADRFADGLSSLMETFVKTATVTVPGTGMVAGSTPVTGTSITGTLT